MRVFIILILIIVSHNAYANKIIAKIGSKDILTEEELTQHVKLEMLLRGDNSKDMFKYKNFVLNNLINGKIAFLYIQDAKKRMNVQEQDDDINYEQIAKKLEKTINIKNFNHLLTKNSIPYEIFIAKIKYDQSVHLLQNNRIQEPTDEYVKLYMQTMGIKITEQNMQKMKAGMLNQFIMESLNKSISNLRNIYYVEVLDK